MAKGQKTGGRKKGTPNRVTADLKGAILESLTYAGGVEYLVQQARDNPSSYMTLIGKVLPLTVVGDPLNPLKSAITVKFTGAVSDTK